MLENHVQGTRNGTVLKSLNTQLILAFYTFLQCGYLYYLRHFCLLFYYRFTLLGYFVHRSRL